jgi:hypothetical protein
MEDAQQLLWFKQPHDGLSEIDRAFLQRTKTKRNRMEVTGAILTDRPKLFAGVREPSTVAGNDPCRQHHTARKRPLGGERQARPQTGMREEPASIDSLRWGSSKRSTDQSSRFGDNHHTESVAGHRLEAASEEERQASRSPRLKRFEPYQVREAAFARDAVQHSDIGPETIGSHEVICHVRPVAGLVGRSADN